MTFPPRCGIGPTRSHGTAIMAERILPKRRCQQRSAGRNRFGSSPVLELQHGHVNSPPAGAPDRPHPSRKIFSCACIAAEGETKSLAGKVWSNASSNKAWYLSSLPGQDRQVASSPCSCADDGAERCLVFMVVRFQVRAEGSPRLAAMHMPRQARRFARQRASAAPPTCIGQPRRPVRCDDGHGAAAQGNVPCFTVFPAVSATTLSRTYRHRPHEFFFPQRPARSMPIFLDGRL